MGYFNPYSLKNYIFQRSNYSWADLDQTQYSFIKNLTVGEC